MPKDMVFIAGLLWLFQGRLISIDFTACLELGHLRPT